MPSHWGLTPKQSTEAECLRRGRDRVVAGCIALLAGRDDDVDDGLIVALGGPAAEDVLAGAEGGRSGYWPRVWAARGLLHVWDDSAVSALRGAACDDAWRVRELSAKVVGKHKVDALLEDMVALRGDDTARVRIAAERAVATLTAG
jgi:hypothetical protein